MFNPSWCDRDMTREQWNAVRRIMKKTSAWGEWQGAMARADLLEERAAIADTLREFADDEGYVGVVESGRDCDCVSYLHGTRRKFAGAFEFQKFENDACYWADGIHHVTLCRVSEIPESRSRDLALEAYEDGHAHSVSEVRYDEEGTYYV